MLEVIIFKPVGRSVSNHVTVALILFYIEIICHSSMMDSQSMVAWELTEYKTSLKATTTARPKLAGPYDVLIKITASSVNPLDVLMTDGYGHRLLNALRNLSSIFEKKTSESEFPIILGRDFVGVVIEKGEKVKGDIKIGDNVIGVTRPFQQGDHAEYVVVSESLITKKPENMTDAEAASLLYAGLTAWSALKVSGLLFVRSAHNKKVLVLGGSGGVGSIAIQLLKNWGATVGTTCSTGAIELVKKYNPDFILDYTSPKFLDDLEKYGTYDIILDSAGIEKDQYTQYTKHLKAFSFSTFISLMPPVLPNTDSYGLILGNVKTVIDFFAVNALSASIFNSSSIRWGFFIPFPFAIKELAELASQKKIIVTVEKTYNFSETPEAYDKVKKGHLRGKIAVLVNDADKLRH